MWNVLFKVVLTINAISLMGIIFLEHNRIIRIEYCLLCVLIPIVLTGLSILLSAQLGKDEFKAGDLVAIESANDHFLPVYLGYCFVALSVNDSHDMMFIFLLIFVLTYLSQTLYFNPLFLVYGWKFYTITTKRGAVMVLISRQNYKTPDNIEISIAYRLNDHTFIELTK